MCIGVFSWLILELKREFTFEESLRVMEVMWASLPPTSPQVRIKFDKDVTQLARFADNTSNVRRRLVLRVCRYAVLAVDPSFAGGRSRQSPVRIHETGVDERRQQHRRPSVADGAHMCR